SRLQRIPRRTPDHPPSQRTVTGTPSALAPVPQKCPRTVEDERYDPIEQGNRQSSEHRGGCKHAHRGLHLPALPHNLDLPGTIGKKDRRGDYSHKDEKAEKATDHDRVLAFSGSSGAL